MFHPEITHSLNLTKIGLQKEKGPGVLLLFVLNIKANNGYLLFLFYFFLLLFLACQNVLSGISGAVHVTPMAMPILE